MATVNIDSTWLTNAGAAPYVLNQPNTLYVLQQDVNVTTTGFYGEVFKLAAKNVYLDKNGHLIQVNGVDMPQVDDSHVYRRVSEYTVRDNKANDVVQFGGKYFDGTRVQPIVDPNANYLPLITPWADTR